MVMNFTCSPVSKEWHSRQALSVWVLFFSFFLSEKHNLPQYGKQQGQVVSSTRDVAMLTLEESAGLDLFPVFTFVV